MVLRAVLTQVKRELMNWKRNLRKLCGMHPVIKCLEIGKLRDIEYSFHLFIFLIDLFV